ncbi:HAD-IIIC family phosphatase [Actinomadura viridis]|uniref:FkbH-like protein n=1 Tax=Actinomadura viridis TaxID=58110 RepID=A0A931DD07_9ACTN|nr:HAD-IIIC family phosphatase [Actinomadura viridis]MBG6086842.1 FkbH-like protein [Actinomadura viridis]
MERPDDDARQVVEELDRLAGDGGLAGAYDRLPALLAGLPAEHAAAAGHRLAGVDPAEVAAAHPRIPRVRVTVTGNFTLTPLAAPLTAEIARHGLLPDVAVRPYGRYVTDLSDPDGGLYARDAEVTLCVLDGHAVVDELPLPWDAADLERALAAKLEQLRGLVAAYRAHGRGTLVLNTLPLLRRFTHQLIDHRSRARAGAAWRSFNAALLELGAGRPGVLVVDTDPLVAETGPALDARLSAYAGAHFSAGLLAAYCREVGHLIRGLRGRARKCLVLDLDGTLWGGVLADDGPAGVVVGGPSRGAAYRSFQRVVRQLGAQGVLLAVSSKNDPEEVARALREHPDMVVRERDFVAVEASGRPKPEALADIADRLGLGPEGLVFVDDHPSECGMARALLPSVAVVPVPGDPALHVERLLAGDWFAVPHTTAEDAARTGRYRTEERRRALRASLPSAGEYREALASRAELFRAGSADHARIAQLTLRTNRFNLTTARMTEAEVRAFAERPGTLVLAARAADRFGDHGLVGCAFARRDGGTLEIVNLLLSCRVFSRGIETACLAALLAHARGTGLAAVRGRYRPSPRNAPVRDFYPRHGFTPAGLDGDTELYRHDLTGPLPEAEHLSVTVELDKECERRGARAPVR